MNYVKDWQLPCDERERLDIHIVLQNKYCDLLDGILHYT